MADARANMFNRASRDDEILKRRIFPEDDSPDLVRMNVLVTEEQKRFLKVRAATTGKSISSWLRMAIDAEMRREEVEHAGE